eukprot:COSAG05_NODE_1652_length_4335_cov_49.472380_6_plen_52_part_00
MKNKNEVTDSWQFTLRLYGFAYNSGSSRASYDIMTGIGSWHARLPIPTIMS